MLIGGPGQKVNIEQFLSEYWQKKPLVIRNAIPNFKDPLSPEELAGLACENVVDARIITRHNDSLQVQNSPLTEEDFTSLPEHDWTLLVQSVDPWFEQVKELLNTVSFLPSWRVDDVMVSYAEKNASAGPHFDYYDVFIIQGQGSRTWKLGQQCNSKTELIADSGLKLVKNFEQQSQWHLNPGDVLYIPPGLAHYGISNNSSMSYSIGFRAPSWSEMLISYSDEICAELSEDKRYSDASQLSNSVRPGEISTTALQQVNDSIQAAFNQPEKQALWFGKHMTEPKLPGIIAAPDDIMPTAIVQQLITDQKTLLKHPACRAAWFTTNDQLNIFMDGENFTYKEPSTLLESLNLQLNSNTESIENSRQYVEDSNCLQLLCDLINQGSLIFADSDEEEYE